MKIYKIVKQQQSAPKKVCQKCHGDKYIYKKIKNLGTLDWNERMLVCDMCGGKGYISQEDIDAQRHREGLIPCPHN